ncbi:MAG: hypothetical protein K2F79_01495, partial [Muribaculaceae bacterium]|nr:hypothetical protein [Muribaculaceae bacterium]
MNHQELWAKCCEFIKDNISAQQYDTWFRDISSDRFADGKLVLLVQSSFFVDQLQARFQGVLRAGIKKVYGEGVQLFYKFRTVNSDPESTVTQKDSGYSSALI